ncbi:MAG: type IX secretion system membrane protein PorP/SprF, partial [Bacteroidia bacterium]|nr:type IX secretion system membrane protein PorP/SprF [Bacteroidia bacterium]
KTYNPGYTNSESIAALIGVEQMGGKLKFCYSYDYTISKLTSTSTSGAHEISIIYELYRGSARKKVKPTISTPMKF